MLRSLLLPLALSGSLAVPTLDTSSEVDAAAQAWRGGDPVYVSPASGALSPGDADALRERITGWRDDVHVAVLPAVAIRQDPAVDDAGEASALLDDLHEAAGAQDGLYLVNLSGAGTYAAGYGDAPSAGQVGGIVAGEVADHTLGQVDQVLDGTLDELGAPAASGSGGGVPVGWVVVGLVLVAALAACATLLVVRRRRRPRRGAQRRASGETWAGPADYRPSYATYADESDTVEERAALAREDVTRLGEELDAADPPLDRPEVAAHVQSALDAYADAARRVDSLTTDAQLNQLAQVTEYARWQLAAAQAVLAGTTPPARRVACFVDPAHGLSVADVSWAPPGGRLRPVPVCRACYERITGGAT